MEGRRAAGRGGEGGLLVPGGRGEPLGAQAKASAAEPASGSRTGLALLSVFAVSALLLAMAALVSGCTSMGFDHPALRDSMDFGPPQQVRICVYLDDGITQDEASRLLDGWNQEAAIYKLYIEPVSFEHMEREGFFHRQILDQVEKIPLGSSCDRVLYFVNRNLGDVAYGLTAAAMGLPEVLGEVDDPTLTHGFVVARIGSINQAIMTPSSVTEHELFHLLGCPHHFDMPDCYQRIQSLKSVEAKLTAQGYYEERDEQPFYPTFASLSDGMLLSREQVDGYPEERKVDVAAVAAR